MISSVRAVSDNLSRTSPPAGLAEGVKPPSSAASECSGYGKPFWFAYGANTSMMVAVCVLYRYADLVSFLGGTEWNLGLIVGIGMVGSLLMRLAQGIGIDQYGARLIWLGSTALFIVSCAAHLAVTEVDGPLIFILRVLYQTSIAGVFGASITYVSRRVPLARMAEIVGTLGTSGFVAMVLGAWLGDAICGDGPIGQPQLTRLFVAAAVMGLLSMALAYMATRGAEVPPRRRRVSTLGVLRRYHPGPVMAVSVAMGFGIGLFPGTFLRAFAAALNIPGIAMFFSVYAPTAFVTRLTARRMPEKYGIQPMIFVGLGSLITSVLLCLTVRTQWQLVFPAFFLGVAHAMLFPAVVAGGTSNFPERYRGLGTTLILAMFDLGALVGAPIVGGLLRAAEFAGWPRYPTMFLTVAILLCAVTVYYWISTRRAEAHRAQRHGLRLARRRTRGKASNLNNRTEPVAQVQ